MVNVSQQIFIDIDKLKPDPRYTKEQVKILNRVIQKAKNAGDIEGVKFYKELIEKGGVDIDINKMIASPPPQNTGK